MSSFLLGGEHVESDRRGGVVEGEAELHIPVLTGFLFCFVERWHDGHVEPPVENVTVRRRDCDLEGPERDGATTFA